MSAAGYGDAFIGVNAVVIGIDSTAAAGYGNITCGLYALAGSVIFSFNGLRVSALHGELRIFYRSFRAAAASGYCNGAVGYVYISIGLYTVAC